jgi:ArsR family transcriptional regulator, arsenate/arsenite/antimonite-responsive transcriptional repressor
MDPVQLFKCLADEIRLTCTLLIDQAGEVCVCELVDALEQSQPKISRHLAQLRNCGLLVDRRKGQWVFYSINPTLPDWAGRIIAEVAKAEKKQLNVLLKKLKLATCEPARC